MSAIEDLKDKLQTQLLILGDRIQESSIYIEIKDRYENLNSRMQVVVKIVVSLMVFLFLYSFIHSPLTTANENITSYQEKRELLRTLLKTSRASQDVPALPVAPAIDSIRFQLDSYFRQIGLVDSQISGIFPEVNGGLLIPTNMSESALKVQLSKLNLKQVTDISHRLTNIAPSVKLLDLSMIANIEDARYYDVTWKLVSLKIPVVPPPTIEPAETKKPKGRR